MSDDSRHGQKRQDSLDRQAQGRVPPPVEDEGDVLTVVDGAMAWAPSSGSDPEATHFIGDPGEPAFQNGFINQGVPAQDPAGFYADSGRVYLQGLLDASAATGLIPFTLPAGYAPPNTRVLWTGAYDPGASEHKAVLVEIGYTGDVYVLPAAGGSIAGWTVIMLTGLDFPVP